MAFWYRNASEQRPRVYRKLGYEDETEISNRLADENELRVELHEFQSDLHRFSLLGKVLRIKGKAGA